MRLGKNDAVPGGPVLFGPEMLQDPYPYYHKLRATDPVYRNPKTGHWIVTRYVDVASSLRDHRFSSDRIGRLRAALPPEFADTVLTAQATSMLHSDEPAHARLRRLVSKAFTPHAVEAMRPFVQDRVDRYLDTAQARGGMDVIHDLALPLPIAVIARMLGVPEEDGPRLKHWSDEATMVLANVFAQLSAEDLGRAAAGSRELREYFGAHFERLRAEPQDNLLSAMVEAEEGGEKLNEEELFSNAILLLAAGHETTTNLIGNGLLALLRHPDQLAMLRSDPALLENAVEECLRYDSPVQFTSRTVTESLPLGGKALSAGDPVLLVLGAANRDPEEFPDPDRLDVRREAVHHVAFSQGPHYCLGAPLARLEGEIALGTLLRRFPGLHLAGEAPRYRSNFNLRGLESLRVAF